MTARYREFVLNSNGDFSGTVLRSYAYEDGYVSFLQPYYRKRYQNLTNEQRLIAFMFGCDYDQDSFEDDALQKIRMNVSEFMNKNFDRSSRRNCLQDWDSPDGVSLINEFIEQQSNGESTKWIALQSS